MAGARTQGQLLAVAERQGEAELTIARPHTFAKQHDHESLS
jgi:hypothetical protein